MSPAVSKMVSAAKMASYDTLRSGLNNAALYRGATKHNLTSIAQNSCPESSQGVDCYNSYNSAAAKVSDKIVKVVSAPRR